MYKNIVVPIDVEHAEHASALLRRAKQVASDGAKVTLTHVVEDVPGLFSEALPDELVERASHEARGKLESLAKNAGIKANLEIRSGRPHRAIVDLAKDLGADLILLGSHQPGAASYVLGSTASSVTLHANCSVLVER